MRSDKFKFIMDAMASHAIEETNSEYSASFLSLDGRQLRGNSNPHQKGQSSNPMGDRFASTVLEVDEMSESSKQGITPNMGTSRMRRYVDEEDAGGSSYYDADDPHRQHTEDSEESL